MSDHGAGGPTGAIRRAVTPVRALAVRKGRAVERPEELVTEEPLEIRAAGPGQDPEPVAVTMRTPGHDFELAVGFLLGEGVLTDAADVDTVRYCRLGPEEAQSYNVVTVSSRVPVDRTVRRQGAVNASCGVCGLTSLDELERRLPGPEARPASDGPRLAASVLASLPDRLRSAQRIFDRTGGLHGAGLYRPDGAVEAVREDVGRHNAVDKLVGWAALAGRLPLAGSVLVVSGRVSFEIVQKAAVAGLGVVAAVSAPSSLAVASAERLGMTLAGFVREGRVTLYSHPHRVNPAE